MVVYLILVLCNVSYVCTIFWQRMKKNVIQYIYTSFILNDRRLTSSFFNEFIDPWNRQKKPTAELCLFSRQRIMYYRYFIAFQIMCNIKLYSPKGNYINIQIQKTLTSCILDLTYQHHRLICSCFYNLAYKVRLYTQNNILTTSRCRVYGEK